MYHLLIADDEDHLRDLIIKQIDWELLGFCVRGARDGKEALEIVRDGFVPDALLTDIRMPFVDGLELSEQLKSQFPDIAIIVLSGHDEFSYAKKSMQLGTSDYLLKPIRPHALVEAMQKLKAQLDEKANRQKELEHIEMQLEESLPILRQQYLLIILYDSYPEEMVRDQFRYLGIGLAGQTYTVCVLSHPPIENPADKFFHCFAVQNVLQKFFPGNAVCFFDSEGTHIILCAGDESSDRRSITEGLSGAIRQIRAQFSITATAAVGADVSSLSDLPVSYKSACAALNNQVIGGNGNVYDALSESAFLGSGKFELPFSLSAKFAPTFPYEQADVLIHHMETMFDEIRFQNCTDIAYLRVVCADLVGNVNRAFMEYGSFSFDGEIYHKLFTLTTLDELQEAVTDYVLSLKRHSDDERKQKQKGLIQQAFEYIEENYRDPALSLSVIAQHLYVSPSYLSNLFKRKCEMNFVDYVTRLRMESAKKMLLSTGLKAYEIALQVGYKDPQYFSNSFKKYTGLTPSEFRSDASPG